VGPATTSSPCSLDTATGAGPSSPVRLFISQGHSPDKCTTSPPCSGHQRRHADDCALTTAIPIGSTVGVLMPTITPR
jgi:hypothetical protein